MKKINLYFTWGYVLISTNKYFLKQISTSPDIKLKTFLFLMETIQNFICQIIKKRIMKYSFLLFLLFTTTITHAQSINTSLGIAGFGSPFDGYYFSFDYEKKLSKIISIAPTFSFISNTKFKNGDFLYKSESNLIKYDNLKNNFARQAGLAELFLYVHPLSIFKKVNLEKNDIKIGFGYGISSHTFIFFRKDKDGNITMGSTYGIFASYSSRLSYNYYFNNYFCGFTLGLTDLKAYGTSLIGVNLGVRFK